MSNMPHKKHYTAFAIVIVIVCVPFFVLIIFLNTDRGMNYWKRAFAWMTPAKKEEQPVLVSAKSFDSQMTDSGTYRLQRWYVYRRVELFP